MKVEVRTPAGCIATFENGEWTCEDDLCLQILRHTTEVMLATELRGIYMPYSDLGIGNAVAAKLKWRVVRCDTPPPIKKGVIY